MQARSAAIQERLFPHYERVKELPHPLIPADAGTQTLPNCMDVQWGKGWFPASAGMSGWRGSPFISFLHTLITHALHAGYEPNAFLIAKKSRQASRFCSGWRSR